MITEDLMVLDKAQQKYPDDFNKEVCIEGGSINHGLGSVSFFLGPDMEFIGINAHGHPLDDEYLSTASKDQIKKYMEDKPSLCITWLGWVKDYPGYDIADLVVCVGCFDRDYYWKETSNRLLELLKPGGLFIFGLCTSKGHKIGEYFAKKIEGVPFLKAWHHSEMEEHLNKSFGISILERIITKGSQLYYCGRNNLGEVITPYQFKTSRSFHYIIGRKNVE